MRKHYTNLLLLFLSILVSYGTAFSQGGTTRPSQSKWTVSEPFEQKVFIENNEGQLNGKVPTENGTILYTTRITGVDVYFTNKGITYRYDKFPAATSDKEEKEDREEAKPETSFFSVEWENANPNVELISEDEVSFYYCYPQGNKHTTVAHAFKKILYKNLYTGIDVEYRFPQNEKGLEYSIIVHPGADLSQVKLLYKDAQNSSLLKGNIVLQSSFGKFTDHEPTNVFYQETKEKATASFTKKGNEIIFSSNYDKTKTLVIDPWIVNPLFTGYDAGYDISYDLKGNVYAYGSFNPYQEIKIDSSGNIQWVFNAIYPNNYPQFGAFAVDEVSGTSYLGGATYPTILKVNTLGIQKDTFYIGSNMEELWRMAYNKNADQLVIGGGGTTDSNQICLLDTGLTLLKPYDILNTNENQHDDAMLTIDNNSSSIYIAIMQSNASSDFNNVLVNCSLPSMSTNYIVSDGFSFYEGLPGLSYINGVNGYSGSPNGAVAGSKWLYLYDGAILRRYSKATGGIALSKTISYAKMHWSGIDMDLCENLYLANDSVVNIYDTVLNLTGTYSMSQPIYDLHTTPYNQIILCGNQFVSLVNLNLNNISITRSYSNKCMGAIATAELNSWHGDSSQFTYLWSNGATTQTVTGLTPGNYTVTVSPHCGSPITDTVNISGGLSSLLLSIGGQHIACNGIDSGNAYVSVLYANSTQFTYLWSNGATTDTINRLPDGTYSVIVTDSCGNSGTASVIITNTANLNLLLQSHNIQCHNINKGSIKAIIIGGAPPYIYHWSNGGTIDSINNLSAGTYSLSVVDACGNSATTAVTITQPTQLAVAASVFNYPYICSAGLTLNASASGGTPPYLYDWKPLGDSHASFDTSLDCRYTNITPPVWVVITDADGCRDSSADQNFNIPPQITSLYIGGCPNDTTADAHVTTCSNSFASLTYSLNGGPAQLNSGFSNLSAGTYTITVKDIFTGCTVDTTFTLYNVFVGASVTSNVNCYGGNNGGATCLVLSPYTPINYIWEPDYNTNSTISGLSAGIYTVYVYNSGCIFTQTVTISQPPAILVSASATNNVHCYGATTGSASCAASGGIAPYYYYLWSPSGGTNSTASGLSAGTYTIRVTDLNGCTATASVSITQPTQLSVSASATANELCYGENIGSILSNASGGTLPYTYTWSPPEGTNPIASGLSAGTYTITVKDKNGCTATASESVTQPSIINVTATTLSNVTCGGTLGSASSTVIGGTIPYTYLWSPSAQTNASATGLSAGTYTLTVTDNNGCTGTASVAITQPPVLIVTTTVTPVTCILEGTATATVTNGVSPYTYFWTGGGTGVTATGLSVGTYTILVTDNYGCTGSATATITQINSLHLSASIISNVLCFGGNSGSASSVISGAMAPYTYLWSGSGGTLDTTTGLSIGTYTIHVTDNSGCTGSASVSITQPTSLNISATVLSNVICYGGNNGRASSSVNGGTLPYTYLWSNSQTIATASGLTAGTYTLDVTDHNGCRDSTTITITQPSGPSIILSNIVNEPCNGDSIGGAIANVSGGSIPYTYSWSNGESTFVARNLSAGTYTVSVTDACGTTITASVTITQPSPLSIASAVVNIPCYGESSGSASVTASGGTMPYTYSWYLNVSTTDSATGYKAGTYTVTVKDNCGRVVTTSVTITQPSPMHITTHEVDDTGSNSGSAAVNVSGGTLPYTYLWEPGGQTTDSISGLSGGIDTCIVTDANDCSITTRVIVNNTTGIENFSSSERGSINVYPNPNNGQFTIELTDITTKPLLEIYDVLGQRIYQSVLNAKSSQVNMNTQAAGIYFYRVTTTSGILLGEGKVIKEK